MNSTFNTAEVEQFLLNMGNEFASLCFHNDFAGGDTAEYIEVSNWFQRYFTPNTAHFIFRVMETHCVQHMELEF
jgi:hypothetical protein